MSNRVSPKEILRDELDAREWNAKTLAAEAGWTPQLAADIMGGRKITRMIAIGLSQALGTSQELWLNLQANYDADNGSQASAPARGKRGRKSNMMPVTVPAIEGAKGHVFEPPIVTTTDHTNGAEVHA